MLDLSTTLILNALSAALVLSLVALGLAIIFGLMGVINLAHGAFLTVGAYVAWAVPTYFGASFWVGLILAPLVVAVLGILIERVVIRYLYDRLLDTILATWGISLVIIESVKLIFGTTSKSVQNPLSGSVDIGLAVYPLYRLFLIGLCIVILTVVFVFFKTTDVGVRVRAVIQDSDTASLQGINNTRMNQYAFGLGAGIAGFAGAAISPITTISPEMGVTYLLQSFFAVILGGTGALIAIIPGSLVVGGSTNFMTFFISPVVAQTLVFIFVILIMIVRPQGIIQEK